jgi:cytochrome c oxidase accessory protein FixG
MCPWPRIQTAMLDEKSLIVTYKDWRGEPRTQGLKRTGEPVQGLKRTGEPVQGLNRQMEADYPVETIGQAIAPKVGAKVGAKVGDCIDCNQCVAVCPTGIDIRQGPQLGCITCALCIDACDKVMAQIGRPRGLIDYATLDDAVIEKAGGTAPPILKTMLRPRTLVYFTIWATIGLAMLFSLGERSRLEINAEADRNPRYVQLSDGAIRNSYTLKLRNMEARPRDVDLLVEGLPGAVVWSEGQARDTAGATLRLALQPDAATKVRLFVAAPAAGAQETAFRLIARPSDISPDQRANRPAIDDVTFQRPEIEAGE